MKQRYNLSHDQAMRIVQRIQAELEKDGRGAAAAVVDDHGELLAFVRTDGCPLPSINNAIHKAFTAAREGKESAAIGAASREEGFAITNFGAEFIKRSGGHKPTRGLINSRKLNSRIMKSGLLEIR